MFDEVTSSGTIPQPGSSSGTLGIISKWRVGTVGRQVFRKKWRPRRLCDIVSVMEVSHGWLAVPRGEIASLLLAKFTLRNLIVNSEKLSLNEANVICRRSASRVLGFWPEQLNTFNDCWKWLYFLQTFESRPNIALRMMRRETILAKQECYISHIKFKFS